MHIERHEVDVVTTDVNGYTPVVTGRILSIQYVKDDTAPYANGVDFTITAETTEQTIWTEENVDASKTCLPRQATHSTAGVALTLEGNEPACEPVYLANERVKITIANGGTAKTGKFYVTVG